LPIEGQRADQKIPAPALKEEDVANEIRDLKKEVMAGHYEVPAREVAEAVMFWHFGRPTDLFWAYGIPTPQQREVEAKRAVAS
jgi:hypothetical protein